MLMYNNYSISYLIHVNGVLSSFSYYFWLNEKKGDLHHLLAAILLTRLHFRMQMLSTSPCTGPAIGRGRQKWISLFTCAC